MHIHMEEQETSVLIPRNRFNQVSHSRTDAVVLSDHRAERLRWKGGRVVCGTGGAMQWT